MENEGKKQEISAIRSYCRNIRKTDKFKDTVIQTCVTHRIEEHKK
jgi:hypothetical protein